MACAKMPGCVFIALMAAIIRCAVFAHAGSVCDESGSCVERAEDDQHVFLQVQQGRMRRKTASSEGGSAKQQSPALPAPQTAVAKMKRRMRRKTASSEGGSAKQQSPALPAPLQTAVAKEDPLLTMVHDVAVVNNDSFVGSEAHDVEKNITAGATINTTQIFEVINKGASEMSVNQAAQNGALITGDTIAELTHPSEDIGEKMSLLGCHGHSMCVQGDIVAANATQFSMLQVGGAGAGNTWAGGLVRYCFAPHVTDQIKLVFEYATVQLHSAVPCITFQEVPTAGEQCSEEPAIRVIGDETGCWSRLGQTGGTQPLHLEPEGCSAIGTVIHEISHAIGVAHEQSRPDRDNFVTIHWNNIEPEKVSNFEIADDAHTSLPYDYLSVMHYSNHYFSINGGETISANDGSVLGQRVGLTQSDADQLGSMYGCGANTLDTNTRCVDEDPNHCASLTTCSTTEDLMCCACKGGVQMQCWQGESCESPAALPFEHASCLVDRTADFTGYQCVTQNACNFDLVVTACPTSSHKIWEYGQADCCQIPDPAMGSDPCTGVCAVVAGSPIPPPTPQPTPPPTPPPTPQPTPYPTPVPEPGSNGDGCVEDWTYKYSSYSCVVKNICAVAVRIRCPGHPGKFYDFGAGEGPLLPPFGTDICDGICFATVQ